MNDLEVKQKRIKNQIDKLVQSISEVTSTVSLISIEIRKREKLLQENDAEILILQLQRNTLEMAEKEKSELKGLIKAIKTLDESAINRKNIIHKLIREIRINNPDKTRVTISILFKGHDEPFHATINCKTKRIELRRSGRINHYLVYEIYS
jgi:chromosome segregation ATPase